MQAIQNVTNVKPRLALMIAAPAKPVLKEHTQREQQLQVQIMLVTHSVTLANTLVTEQQATVTIALAHQVVIPAQAYVKTDRLATVVLVLNHAL